VSQNILGSGQFGNVFKGSGLLFGFQIRQKSRDFKIVILGEYNDSEKHWQPVAVKQIRLTNSDTEGNLAGCLKELGMMIEMSGANHEHLARFIGFCTTNERGMSTYPR